MSSLSFELTSSDPIANGKRIALVEDCPIITQMWQRQLKNHTDGWQLSTFPNAYELFIDGISRYDIIVMDQNLKHIMDGSDAIKLMRDWGYKGKIFGYTTEAEDDAYIAKTEGLVDIRVKKGVSVSAIVNMITEMFCTTE